jgi:hypothetical protein
MSTRGFVGVRENKQSEIFGHYNHSDSYPTGLGVSIAEAIDGKGSEYITKWFNESYFLVRGLASEQHYREYHNFCEYLLENQKCYIRSGGDFYKDALFCEWSYIFNLEEKTISVYSGCGRTPEKGLEDWNTDNEYFVFTVGEFTYDEFTPELMERVYNFYRIESNNGKPYKAMVETAKIVRFDYVNKAGERSNRLVKVQEENGSMIKGIDLNKNEFRAFSKSTMKNLKEVII